MSSTPNYDFANLLINILSIIINLLPIIVSLISLVISIILAVKIERLKRELDWNYKTREKAAKVAEYLAHQMFLTEKTPIEEYIKVNQMAWELALWVPKDLYVEIAQAAAMPDKNRNFFSAIIKARKLLLKEKAGDLSMEHALIHYPGAGKNKPN